ncbi:MAG: hypothetical protein ACI82A_000282 [Candidatus Azotimanducaceae bacterium]|jgi:hypothetical protein
MMRTYQYLLSLAIVTLSYGSSLNAEELPQNTPADHLGVATCASSVCHGSVRTRTATAVNQNEYVIWSQRDRHRASYNTLLTDESKAIAKKLGLKGAHKADMCLDCHADNVAEEHRGDRFQITDGVGCESCHGGSENYISTHVDDAATHVSNVADGMYPTDDPRSRAKLCLSCHLGTSDKMASHDIMGAGHPRISFELDTFGWLQPAHYTLDDDYRAEKWAGSSIELWAVGQIEASRQTLHLIQTRLNKGGLFPELALFDCHSCHHSMSEQSWQKNSSSSLPPGSVRLNDANFVMLFAIAKVLDEGLEQDIRAGLRQLHQTVDKGHDLTKATTHLRALLDRLDARVDSTSMSGHAGDLIASIIDISSGSQMIDYVSAEQSLMAVDMLLSTTGQRDSHDAWLSKAYESLGDEDNFNTVKFSRLMKSFKI